MSTLLLSLVDKDGKTIDTGMPVYMTMATLFPSRHPFRAQGSTYRSAATNIYKIKDGSHYHIHGTCDRNPLPISVAKKKLQDV